MHSLIVIFVLLSSVESTSVSITVTPRNESVNVQSGQPFTLTCLITDIVSSLSGIRWYRDGEALLSGSLDTSICVSDVIVCQPINTTDNRGTIRYEMGTNNDATTTLTIQRSNIDDNATFNCAALRRNGGSISGDIRVTVIPPTTSLLTTPIDSATEEVVLTSSDTSRNGVTGFYSTRSDQDASSTSQVLATFETSDFRPTPKSTDVTTLPDPITTTEAPAADSPLNITVIAAAAGACGAVIIILLIIIACLLWSRRKAKRSRENTEPAFTNFRLSAEVNSTDIETQASMANAYENHGHTAASTDHESLREEGHISGQLARPLGGHNYQNVPLRNFGQSGQSSQLPSDTDQHQIIQPYGVNPIGSKPSPPQYTRPMPPQKATTPAQYAEASPSQPRSTIHHTLHGDSHAPAKKPNAYSTVNTSEPISATNTSSEDDALPVQPHSPVYVLKPESHDTPANEANDNANAYASVIKHIKKEDTDEDTDEDDTISRQPLSPVYHVLQPNSESQQQVRNYDYAYAAVTKPMGEDALSDDDNDDVSTGDDRQDERFDTPEQMDAGMYASVIKHKKKDTKTEGRSEDNTISRQPMSPLYHVLEPDSENTQEEALNYYAYADLKTMADNFGEDAASHDEDVRTEGDRQDEKLDSTCREQVDTGMYAEVGPINGPFGSPSAPLDETAVETPIDNVNQNDKHDNKKDKHDNKNMADNAGKKSKKKTDAKGEKNGLKTKSKKDRKPGKVDTRENVDRSGEFDIGDRSVQDDDSLFVDNVLYVASTDDVVVNDRHFGDIDKFGKTARGKARLDPF